MLLAPVSKMAVLVAHNGKKNWLSEDSAGPQALVSTRFLEGFFSSCNVPIKLEQSIS